MCDDIYPDLLDDDDDEGVAKASTRDVYLALLITIKDEYGDVDTWKTQVETLPDIPATLDEIVGTLKLIENQLN
jgi:hypothetical protein